MEETAAYKRVLSELNELKQMMLSFGERLENKTKLISLKNDEGFITVKEAAYLIKKERKTVENYCKEYPEIRRKKEGRENLIQQKDFLKAYEKGRKTPFNREVFNRQKVA